MNHSRRYGIIGRVLSLLAACVIHAGCQRDVTIEIRHSLRDSALDHRSGDLQVRYLISTTRNWTNWPCLSHGCGDSQGVDQQSYLLRWALPERLATRSSQPIEPVVLQTDISKGSKGSSDVSAAVASFDRFAADARLGRWPVRDDGGAGCRRVLPCFVSSFDRSYMLVVQRIFDMETNLLELDLAGQEGYAAFVDAAITKFSYPRSTVPFPDAPVECALANDLRHIVAYPRMNQCFPEESLRRYNSVLVYEVASDQFEIFVNEEMAEAGLQPTAHTQYVYLDGDSVHLVSRYASRSAPPDASHLGCIDQAVMTDFDSSTGINQPIDTESFIGGGYRSLDGSVMLSTRFDFENGVVPLTVYDMPARRPQSYLLSLPSEILAQVAPEKERLGVVNGEFTRVQNRRRN